MHGIWCTPTDVWTVAQTCYGEARDYGGAVIYAIAWIIRNRHETIPRWNVPFVAICRAPMQFPCWDPGSPHLNPMRHVSLNDRVFCQCMIAAVEVLGGMTIDTTHGSTHYYVEGGLVPVWAEGHVPTIQIGRHVFFHGIT